MLIKYEDEIINLDNVTHFYKIQCIQKEKHVN